MIAALICSILSIQNVNAKSLKFLYDLESDPYESTNLFDSTLHSHVAIKDEFTAAQTYWESLVYSLSYPNYTIRNATWYKNGGVSAWLTSDFEVRTIKQKYSYENAPNIVFVHVDDWGYNDVGFRSNYLSWTTPAFDAIASQGITLSSYWTNYLCAPSRAVLLTGRYSLRTGIQKNNMELPLKEVTLAEELHSAGYRNYLIGKWHLGTSTIQHHPTNRGFDYFFGYLSGEEDYYTKRDTEFKTGYLDWRENMDLVTDEALLDESVHSAHVYDTKVHDLLKNHSLSYPDTPLFLLYSMQLVHSPYVAPEGYLKRCESYKVNYPDNFTDDYLNYCAMNVMLDEAIANLTCYLKKYDFNENTVLIIAGDNGGVSSLSGSNYPLKGSKGEHHRGAVSNTAIIHSTLIPEDVRGLSYSGDVYIGG